MNDINIIIAKKKVLDLKPADYNPRKMKKAEMAKLRKSIETFGYVEPIIWNKKSKNVVGGHQRLKALIALGHQDAEIDVVVVELDDEKEKALNIALNRISGDWQELKLGEILEKMSREDMGLTGMDDDEISKYVDQLLDEREHCAGFIRRIRQYAHDRRPARPCLLHYGA